MTYPGHLVPIRTAKVKNVCRFIHFYILLQTPNGATLASMIMTGILLGQLHWEMKVKRTESVHG